jgi:hypothetical protein
MATEIRVPTLGESVTEATIGKWFKKVGDAVATDETAGRTGNRQGDGRGSGAGGRHTWRDHGQGRRHRRGRRASRHARTKAKARRRRRRRRTEEKAAAPRSRRAGRRYRGGSPGATVGNGHARYERRHAAGAFGGQDDGRQGRFLPIAGFRLRQARPGPEGRRDRRHRLRRPIAGVRRRLDAEGGAARCVAGPVATPSAKNACA